MCHSSRSKEKLKEIAKVGHRMAFKLISQNGKIIIQAHDSLQIFCSKKSHFLSYYHGHPTELHQSQQQQQNYTQCARFILKNSIIRNKLNMISWWGTSCCPCVIKESNHMVLQAADGQIKKKNVKKTRMQSEKAVPRGSDRKSICLLPVRFHLED